MDEITEKKGLDHNLDELIRHTGNPFLVSLKNNIANRVGNFPVGSNEWNNRAKDIVAMRLLNRINERSMNFNDLNRRELFAESSRKIAEMMQGRVTYGNDGGQYFFSDEYNPLQQIVCAPFAGLGLYAANLTHANIVDNGNNSWWRTPAEYNYAPGYTGMGGDGNEMWGVSHLAYNRSLLTPTDYNKQWFQNIGENPSEAQIRELQNLKGMLLFTRHYADTPQDNGNFRGYSHVRTIVGYDITTNELIITESAGSVHVREHRIPITHLTANKYSDVYRPRF